MDLITSMRTGLATRDWNDAFAWQNADPDCVLCCGTGVASARYLACGGETVEEEICPHCYEIRP